MSQRTKVLEQISPGPKIAIVCGAHGNEEIGVLAAEQVYEILSQKKYSGEICIHQANMTALEKGVRYVDRDLNRLWTDERIAVIDTLKDSTIVEERELYQSYIELREFYDGLKVPAYLFDLHGTSSVSNPFSIAFDVGPSLDLATKLQTPTITWNKPDTFWDEVLTSYASRRGVSSIVFEVGPLSDARTADVLAACLWDALAAIEVIGEDCSSEVSLARNTLKEHSERMPKILEIEYEQSITVADQFVMRPGYQSFQRVSKGEYLADDINGKITCPFNSYLLFPLYQGTSDYGFALGVVP